MSGHCFYKTPVILYLFLSFALLAAQEKNLTLRAINFSVLSDYEGLEAAAEGDMTQAVHKFTEALEYYPLNQDARLHLSIITDSRQKKISGSIATKILKGMFLMASGDKQGMDYLNQVIKIEPDYYPTYLLRGMGFMKINAWDLAYTDFNLVVLLAPDQMLGHHWRGKTYLEKKEYRLAIADFSQGIVLDSTWDANYYEQGVAYSRLEQYELAVAGFEQALLRNPTLADLLQGSLEICKAYNSRGVQRLQSNKFSEAIADFDKALELNSLFSEPYLNRGIAYRNKGDYDLAIIDFNHALEMDPKNIDAYLHRALTQKIRRQPDMALADFQKVLSLDSINIQAYYESAEIYFQQEKLDQASSAFRKVMDLDSTYYWAYYGQAQIWDRKKNYKEAIRYYEKFITLAPEEYYDHRLKSWERARKLRRWVERNQK